MVLRVKKPFLFFPNLKSRFEAYFGGSFPYLGKLLFRQLLGHVTGSVAKEMFVSAMCQLEQVFGAKRVTEETESFVFRVFTREDTVLSEKGEHGYVGKIIMCNKLICNSSISNCVPM